MWLVAWRKKTWQSTRTKSTQNSNANQIAEKIIHLAFHSNSNQWKLPYTKFLSIQCPCINLYLQGFRQVITSSIRIRQKVHYLLTTTRNVRYHTTQKMNSKIAGNLSTYQVAKRYLPISPDSSNHTPWIPRNQWKLLHTKILSIQVPWISKNFS